MGIDDIDIRIMGVQERMDNLRYNQEILNVPEDRIVIDTHYDGCKETAKQAWLIDTDKPYVMVLQDDVELCNGFLGYCARIITAHPDKIVSLYSWQLSTAPPKGGMPTSSPYIITPTASGPGIIMKTDYVKPCVESWLDELPGDDTNIQKWAADNGISIVTTVPCILQHVGAISVYDPTRSLGESRYYDKDPSYVNWDTSYVTSWTNIIRD